MIPSVNVLISPETVATASSFTATAPKMGHSRFFLKYDTFDGYVLSAVFE
jgi:hypothetical protein